MTSQTLADIKVQVEASEYESGNLQSILSEITYAVEQLLQKKETHSIDLRAMPWSPGEEAKLEKFLGQGEVSMELNALGKSLFYETEFSGIWLVTHYNEDDEVISKLIEVTYVPDMIFSRHEDINDSLERLQRNTNG